MVTGQAGPCVGNIVAIPRLNFSGLCLQDGPLAIRVRKFQIRSGWFVSVHNRPTSSHCVV
jgi:hypothetical protein